MRCRSVLAACTLGVALTGCVSAGHDVGSSTPAGSSASSTGAGSSTVATVAASSAHPTPDKPLPAYGPGPSCTGPGSAFSASFPSGALTGAPDPVAAARTYIQEGFGSATSNWRLVGSPSRSGGSTTATVTDGSTYVVAFEVSNHTWLIVSGSKCGTEPSVTSPPPSTVAAPSSPIEPTYSTRPGPTCTRSETGVFVDRVGGFLDGAPDPVAAAKMFAPKGFGSATSIWRVVGSKSTRAGITTVTVTDGSAYLVASELSNRTWVIEYAERCTD
jgi:hypothetical protein